MRACVKYWYKLSNGCDENQDRSKGPVFKALPHYALMSTHTGLCVEP